MSLPREVLAELDATLRLDESRSEWIAYAIVNQLEAHNPRGGRS